MKLKNNQIGSAHLVAVLVVLVLAIIAVVGWKVWDNNNQQETPSTLDTSVADTSSNSDKSIEIASLGIKIADPENRGLVLETEEICAESCSQVEMIRDKNDSYFSECEYPASVRKTTKEDFDSLTSDDYYYELTKKVGDAYFQVRTGSNFQQNCKYNADGSNPNEAYEKGLRKYIADNMTSL